MSDAPQSWAQDKAGDDSDFSWWLQIRRPNNYDLNVAVVLGPTDPDPTMDLSSLDIIKTVVQDTPNKLFIGGLPCDWTEDQVRFSLALTVRLPVPAC